MLILYDQRRITKTKKAEHDLGTLKGRTLRLRDDMQSFLDSLPAVPEAKKQEGETIEEFLKRTTGPAGERVLRVFHGYELRFARDAERIYHE